MAENVLQKKLRLEREAAAAKAPKIDNNTGSSFGDAGGIQSPEARKKNIEFLQQEAKRSGISTKGGVVVETRGQKLAADAGQDTLFTGGQKFEGAKSSEFVGTGGKFTTTSTAFADAERPTRGENEDPKDFALREARFDAQQFKSAFEAEQALTSQVKDAETKRLENEREGLFQEKGQEGRIAAARREFNPEYAKLTTEEKILNASRPKEQQIPEFIEFGEGDLTPAQIEARAAGKNVLITNQMKRDKFRSSTPSTFIDPQTGETKKGGIKEHLFKVKEFLGAETGDKLDIRADGSYYLRDEKGEEVDPVKRAEDKVNKEADEAMTTLGDNFRIQSDRIRSLHSTASGQLTTQGKRELAKAYKDYAKDKKDLQEKIDDTLDATIRQEKSRQIDVDTQLEALKAGAADKELSFAQEISKSKVARLNELKASGIDDMVALAQVEREYAMMKDDPAKIELNEFISGLNTSGIDQSQQFGAVYAKAGDDMGAAYSAMVTRYGEPMAKQMRSEFQKAKGWGEEQVEMDNLRTDQESILSGGGDDMALETSALLLKYGNLDKTGLLQEEFARNVVASPDTNFREKSIAQMALAQIAVSRRNQLETKKTVTKDRFGNIILVDPFTGATGGGGGAPFSGASTGEVAGIMPTSDPVVATKARNLHLGLVSPDDVRKTTSEQQMEQVGTEWARLMAEEQLGEKYTPAQKEAGQQYGQIADILQQIKTAINDEESGFEGAVGAGFQKLIPFRESLVPGSKAFDFSQTFEQLSNALAAPSLEKLKGSMSDKDILFIKNIATKLNLGMSEEAFKAEINLLDERLKKAELDEKIELGDFMVLSEGIDGEADRLRQLGATEETLQLFNSSSPEVQQQILNEFQ